MKGKLFMKEIIYLNTGFLHSFMAQSNKGLPLSLTLENTQQDTRTSSEVVKKDNQREVSAQVNSGTINLPFVVSSPSGNGSYKSLNKTNIEDVYSLSQLDAGKEIIAKQLHDNALNEFENYLIEEDSLDVIDFKTNSTDYLGKYVKITSEFKVVDIDYISRITDKDKLIDFLNLHTTQISSKGGEKRVGYNQDFKLAELGIKQFGAFIAYMKIALPTNIFLNQKGYISPLKDEYLRESGAELNFKYSTNSKIKITVLGRATRVFDGFDPNILDDELNEVSVALGSMMNIIYNKFKIIKNGDVIISPIAVYFE